MSSDLLTFSSLYPNRSQPGLGLFVETRLRQLLKVGDYCPRVIAPVPWFPFKAPIFGKYGQFAQVPEQEIRHDIPIWHPRYFHLPKVAMDQAPQRIANSVSRIVSLWQADEFKPRIIDAHYFYPEGVAAAKVANDLDLPLMITARGSDINLISQFPVALAAMQKAAQRASAIVGVSSALAQKMAELGFAPDKIHVLRNGIDLEFFSPGERERLRERAGFNQLVLLSVGNLIELKGHHLVIDALSHIPDALLLIAGSGLMDASLRKRAEEAGVADRVRFLGQLEPQALRDCYRCADALVLASSREGLANVLLESIACGNPVIATSVGGNPEVVSDSRAGVLLEERSVAAIVNAVNKLEMSDNARIQTAEFAHKFTWTDTCHKLDLLIHSIM